MNNTEAMEKFKEFCLNHKNLDNESKEFLEELNWFDMSIGFFIALGCSLEDANSLAANARYKHEYWDN